jgi:PHD/YefM family antitoxin component YafN of YafNO toxin-antitoxin module
MMNINKRYIVDERGNPKEVVILLEDYRKIEEMLGLDLNDETVKQLREAQKDRKSGNKDAYIDLDSIWWARLSFIDTLPGKGDKGKSKER